MAGYTEEQQQGAPTTTSEGAVSTSSTQPQGEQAAVSTDIEHETPAVSPEQQQLVDAVAGTDRQIKTVKDWMDAEEHRPETEEKRKKRERMEKSKKIIAAFSDGLSALSNLYFTSQYAPNMYNHEKGSMTNSVDARIEKMKAEREKKHDEYLQFSLKLGDLENQRAATLRELKALQERQKLAREKAQREAEQHGWMAALQPDKQREQAGKADKAEQEAITAKAEADFASEMQKKKGATEDAKAASYRASAGASHARAKYYGSGGSAGAKKHHFRGKEYVSEKDYTKDVTDAARQYNERHMEEVDDGNGGKKMQYKAGFTPIVIEDVERTANGYHRTPRNPAEYAGEVERRLAEEEQENRPPSRRR